LLQSLNRSGETGMNFLSSHRNYENRIYEGSPPQDPSRGTAGQFRVLKKLLVIDPPRGRPFGGGGVYLK
jgi:hypothetical protein